MNVSVATARLRLYIHWNSSLEESASSLEAQVNKRDGSTIESPIRDGGQQQTTLAVQDPIGA